MSFQMTHAAAAPILALTSSQMSHESFVWLVAAFGTVIYAAGFLFALSAIKAHRLDRRKKAELAGLDPMRSNYCWVPDVSKREMCLRPFYAVMALLPCIFWPVVVACFLAIGIYKALVAPCVKWLLRTSPPTTLCGIPLTRLCRPENGMRTPPSADADVEAQAAGQITVPASVKRAPATTPSISGVDGLCISKGSSRVSSWAPSQVPPAYLSRLNSMHT